MTSINESSTLEGTKVAQQRTYKPIFWSLFAAGGMIAALAVPALVLIFSIWLPFDLQKAAGFYQAFHGIAANGFGLLVLEGILFLMLWHCAHRFYYCLHDIKIHLGFRGKCVLYGIPVAAFVLALICGW